MKSSSIRHFIKGVSFTGIGTVYTTLVGFVGLMIVSRTVPKDDFGVYVIIQVIAAFFLVVGSLAMELTAVTKLIASAEATQKASLANASCFYRVAIDLFICILIFLSDPILLKFFNISRLSEMMMYLCLIYFTTSLQMLFLKVMQGYQQFRQIAVSQFVNGTSKVALIAIMVGSMGFGILGAIYATAISSVLSTAYLFWVKPFSFKIEANSEAFKEIYKFGMPLGLNNALTFVFTKMDRFLIAATMTPASVAYYEVASKIPDNSRLIYSSFQSVYFPFVSELHAKENYDEAESILNNSIRLVSFLTVSMALGATLFQTEIITMMFSERYLPSAPVFPILMLTLSLALVGNVLGTTLVALGHSDKPAKINCVDAMANVIGNLLLIPKMGYLGAAYAALLSRCVANPLNVWFLKKAKVKVDAFQYLKPFFAFAVCTAVFQATNWGGARRLLVLVGYFMLCFLMGTLRNSDLQILVRELKLRRSDRNMRGVQP